MSTRLPSTLLACVTGVAALGLTACPGDDSTDTGAGTSTGGDTGTTVTPGTTTMPDDTTSAGTVGMTESSTGPDPDSTGSGTTAAEESSSGTTAALEPEIEVSIDMVATVSGDSYDFLDTVDVGMVGTPVEVTIDNVGTGDLDVGEIVISAGDDAHFTLDVAMVDPVVPAGMSTSFTVAFSPINGGIKGGTLTINNGDADEGVYDLILGAHTTPNVYRDTMPMTQPVARFNAQLADLEDGRLMMFGGRDASNTRLDDTWLYDVEANTWTQVMPPMAPSARDAYGMAYASGSNTVILYAGNTSFGGGPGLTLDDTWAFDVGTEQWTQLTPAGQPPTIFQHRMVAIGPDAILLYGGRTSAGTEVAATWIYDVVANTWTDAAPTGSPQPLSAFAMDFDGTNTVTLFGGFDNFDPQDVTWAYDVMANTWTQGAPVATPGPRGVLHGGYFMNGSFIVYSGKLNSCCIDPTQGTYAYDPMTDDWTDLAPPSEPPARFNYAYSYVTGANKAIIFGGLLQNTGNMTAQQQTWEYVGPRP